MAVPDWTDGRKRVVGTSTSSECPTHFCSRLRHPLRCFTNEKLRQYIDQRACHAFSYVLLPCLYTSLPFANFHHRRQWASLYDVHKILEFFYPIPLLCPQNLFCSDVKYGTDSNESGLSYMSAPPRGWQRQAAGAGDTNWAAAPARSVLSDV